MLTGHTQLAIGHPNRFHLSIAAKAAIVVAALIGVILALPVIAQSYDRRPVTLSGLYPDGWGQSLGNAAATGRDRFPGQWVYCTGVFMRGYRSDSSWIHGNTRYWDKTFCVAASSPSANRGTTFVLDAKKGRVTMYRVRRF